MTQHPGSPRRRALLAAALAAPAATLLPFAAHAQGSEFPSRPVRIVLPFPPGTANDITLRLVAERLSARWKQPVVVDNRPGGSSIIGTDAVAKSAADGYTLLANITLIVQNPALRKKLPYDPKDLVPVTQLNRQQLAVFVRSELPVRNFSELVAHAQARPGTLNFASWGLGSTAHLMFEKIQLDKGVKMVHVPYKGGAEINKAVLSGEADIGVADLLSPDAFFKAGKLRVIAVTGPRRLARMPEVQTLAEAGVGGFDGYNWVGLFAPASTPAAIVRRISDEINLVQADAALGKRFRDEMFVEPSETTPQDFAKIYERDMATWTQVIRETRVTLD
ncbi:MAG: tripartite tricarboxylate transporter substrate binding protein [Pseudomonadota bacterium]